MYSNGTIRGDTTALIQAIKKEIKEEIIDELRTRQKYDLIPNDYQKEKLKNSREMLEEIDVLEIGGGRPESDDPYLANMGKLLLDEPGIAYSVDRGAIPQWISDQPGDRRREILYGIGAVAILGMLLPPFGQKIQNVFTRTAKESMELIGKARSIAARAKEDLEDLIAEANLKGLMKKPRY